MALGTVNRNSALGGLVWTYLERCGNQGVHFVVSIILARLLMPKIFGTIAIISVLTSIFGIFINFGFTSALVQKKDADDLDYSSVFFFNLFMSAIIYFIIFCSAPFVSSFYEDNSLTIYIRVYSIALLIGSFKTIQYVYIRKNFLFKKFFWATSVGTLLAAFLGIGMAYSGFGVWALIAQSLLNLTVDTLFLWAIVKWRPRFIFSIERLSKLYSFGWKMFVSGILDTLYNRMRTLLIGKVYSMEDLAYYHKGSTLPSLFIENINSSINTVLFPTMSAIQDDKKALRNYTRRALKSSTFFIMPAMAILSASADSIVLLLLTEKWLPAVYFLRISCIVYAFYPVHTANLCAIQALGRSDIFFKLEVIKKLFGAILILSTLWISVKAVAASAIIFCIFGQIVNSFPNKKLLEYSYIEQMVDIGPHLILSIIIGFLVYSVCLFKFTPWITLPIQIILGVFIYWVSAVFFHLESYRYFIKFARDFLLTKFQKNKI